MIEVELRNAKAVFTTRVGGVSEGPYSSLNVGRFTEDDPRAVEANIQKLAEHTGIEEIQFVKQVHGANLHLSDELEFSELHEADGMLSRLSARGLLVTGADCPPVAISDGVTVGMLHCGWRPLAAGIIQEATRFLDADFTAAIGPGICQDHYEVGPEVVEQLGAHAVDNHDGRQLDLKGVITSMLKTAGAARVTDVARCTYCEPEHFFSHRRDNGVTGRQAGIAWLTT